ncbi:ABC transporter ATP-binding protein [Nitrosospira multiformis]|uniref:Lipopolysaccharide transport system ATP-binding protein n=1 Tax=Nitrosospira multiformis TaxID=1231 RepID=A0A1I7HB58_9PROT|nr:ABC transporter ATP-binding protein [Nitrosospira multiformis]SFU57943.1 lipopolysaccharide transport system ATP-binding protein [Nitrosospira multiformis]
MASSPPTATDDINSADIALRISGLSKTYRIYGRSQDRLLQGFWGNRKQLYREFRALDSISFEIRRGETFGIIGPNGSGKSTLLQLIAGTLTPTQGEIYIKGKVSALLELGAGFNGEFTGRENIHMAASIAGLNPGEIRQRYERIAAYADIGDFLDQPVKTYSSGMYVRLAFAVAISVGPEVLIIDEALAVGDMEFQAKCMVTLKQIQERGTTILFVSHDVGAVSALCERTLYLKHGRALEIGPTPDVIARYIREVQETNNRKISVTVFENSDSRTGSTRNASETGITPPHPIAPSTGPEAVSGVASGSSASGSLMAASPFQSVEKEHLARFAENANHCRSGTGDVRVIYAEMTDDNGLPVRSAEFGQSVLIRIIVEAARTCTFSANYKICDKNRTPVIGADFLMQSQTLLTLEPSQQAEVLYRTSLPLTDGRYSLRISLTHPVNAHQQALFFDIVEIAHVFEVLPNPTAKFWTQVYLPNTLDVRVLE